jgi:large subunit ribosomal protein L3
MDALIGTKVGMTQIYDEEGRQIPVTVLAMGPCTVVQRKTVEKDGYAALQIGYQSQKKHRVTKPMQGHFAKAGVDPVRYVREIPPPASPAGEWKAGDALTAGIFKDATHVDVIGTTKGRGFQGVVKRYRMAGGRASHGGGNHRAPGSIGMCEHPARVLKGKKLPGHMGHRRVTVQNLKVIQLREEDHAILVQGAVPGPNGGLVMIRRALKKHTTTT